MPAEGYAQASLRSDRVPSFLALLFGHAANYQSRGVFNAPEQLSLYGDGGDNRHSAVWSDSYRASLAGADLDVDFCVPSTTLVAKMVRWMVVFESDPDVDELWLLKGAPRRFFRGNVSSAAAAEPWCPSGSSMCIAHAPTRFGTVGLVVAVDGANVSATVRLDLHGGGFVDVPTVGPQRLRLVLRVRDPDGRRSLSSGAVSIAENDAGAELAGVDAGAETVAVWVSSPASNASFVLHARLQ